VADSPAASAAYGVGPLYTASLIATYRATEKSDSSTAPTASVRRRARQIERAAKAPITRPAGTNFVPSHGSAPSRRKQSDASRSATRVSSRSASSAAPASAAAAASSGYTADP
jgi:hypothetical protein